MAEEKTIQLSNDFIQLARIALTGRPQDIQLIIHQASKKYRDSFPLMAEALMSLLRESPTRTSPLRKQVDSPLPVDLDSRLQLMRIEAGSLENVPILSSENEGLLRQVLMERNNFKSLVRFGLQPSKSILFTGPPGVGKTLAARWIASQLNRPLLVLDLAAVMSSFLGRTGNNIRHVLDYAKNNECVLLLDELDAIAKRRDDTSEIGELKRLVTVLLQEIDDWPSTGLLIAATNHPSLLDPAVWRRFEVVLDFDRPDRHQIEVFVKKLLINQIDDIDKWSTVLSYIFKGKSYSEIERQITLIRKESAIAGNSLAEIMPRLFKTGKDLSRDERLQLAVVLHDSGLLSQRQAHELTGVSRDTIRKYISGRTQSKEKKSRKSASQIQRRVKPKKTSMQKKRK